MKITDKMRLDWLQHRKDPYPIDTIFDKDYGKLWSVWSPTKEWCRSKNIRTAIDLAITAERRSKRQKGGMK